MISRRLRPPAPDRPEERFVGRFQMGFVRRVVVVVEHDGGEVQFADRLGQRDFPLAAAGEAEVDVFGVETAGDYGFVCHAGS